MSESDHEIPSPLTVATLLSLNCNQSAVVPFMDSNKQHSACVGFAPDQGRTHGKKLEILLELQFNEARGSRQMIVRRASNTLSMNANSSLL